MSKRRKQSIIEKLSYRMTYWVGSPTSVLVHTILFAIAFLLIPLLGFDRVMLVVTTIVSLEAIYLSLFIQMAVNRQHHRIKGIEEDIDDILEDTTELTTEEDEDAK